MTVAAVEPPFVVRPPEPLVTLAVAEPPAG
jgi:hypothetical protein